MSSETGKEDEDKKLERQRYVAYLKLGTLKLCFRRFYRPLLDKVEWQRRRHYHLFPFLSGQTYPDWNPSSLNTSLIGTESRDPVF